MLRYARMVVVLAAVAAVSLAWAGCGEPPKPTGGTYANASWGFSITFPANWLKEEDVGGAIIQGYPPDQAGAQPRFDYLIVSAESLNETFTVDEYAQVKAARGAKVMPNYKELDKSKVDLNGTPAVRIVYNARDEEKDLTSVAYFMVVGQKAFMVIGMAKTDTYKGREPIYDQIAKTFKVTATAAK